MSFKRSRIGDSSTIFVSDVSLPALQSRNATAISPTEQPTAGEEMLSKYPYNPKKVSKQINAESIDRSRRRPTIFTIETTNPVLYLEDVINVGGVNNAGLQMDPTGGLLDRYCYYCMSKFRLFVDLFMYRDLAFCKCECRNSQMKIDSMVAEGYGELKKQLSVEKRASNK